MPKLISRLLMLSLTFFTFPDALNSDPCIQVTQLNRIHFFFCERFYYTAVCQTELTVCIIYSLFQIALQHSAIKIGTIKQAAAKESAVMFYSST